VDKRLSGAQAYPPAVVIDRPLVDMSMLPHELLSTLQETLETK
tara:strand:- start:49285 stop:49413 length:129 start_codon:yes stop_codon:yes gene_type:complete